MFNHSPTLPPYVLQDILMRLSQQHQSIKQTHLVDIHYARYTRNRYFTAKLIKTSYEQTRYTAGWVGNGRRF